MVRPGDDGVEDGCGAANTLFELQSAGAQLVSVKENIDDTASGQLLHAVMAGIAEFYSKNLAAEALKGMTQKAAQAARRGVRRSATSTPGVAAKTAANTAPW